MPRPLQGKGRQDFRWLRRSCQRIERTPTLCHDRFADVAHGTSWLHIRCQRTLLFLSGTFFGLSLALNVALASTWTQEPKIQDRAGLFYAVCLWVQEGGSGGVCARTSFQFGDWRGRSLDICNILVWFLREGWLWRRSWLHGSKWPTTVRWEQPQRFVGGWLVLVWFELLPSHRWRLRPPRSNYPCFPLPLLPRCGGGCWVGTSFFVSACIYTRGPCEVSPGLAFSGECGWRAIGNLVGNDLDDVPWPPLSVFLQ